ncbi:MAG: hypothetical protein ACW979_04045 [Candidatus Thorarchaeota archaeon]
MTITFFATGAVVLAFTFWRIGRFRAHSKFIRNLCDAYQCNGIDLSGDTLYTECISHRWTMKNIVGRKEGRLGRRFQDLMFYSTLTTTVGFSLFFGIGILVFGIILVRSIEIAGMFLFIFFIGAFTILGSGDAKTSRDLLSMLQSHKIKELSKQDYAYAAIARDLIKKELVLSFIIGSILVVFSPVGELVPGLAAWLIATFTQYMIWNPVIFLSEFSVPLALIYLTGVWPVFAIVIIYAIRQTRGREEEIEQRVLQV